MGKELEEKLASRFSIWLSMGGDPLRTAMECSLGSSSKTLRLLFEKSTKHPTELFLYAPSLPLDRHHPLRTGKHKATRQEFFPTRPSLAFLCTIRESSVEVFPPPRSQPPPLRILHPDVRQLPLDFSPSGERHAHERNGTRASG
jgi:hypothetical protein